MTQPRPSAGPPSASGVRRGGDRFQDLFVWGAAMQVLRADSAFSQVEFEIKGAGNVDDVVLRSNGEASDLYGQVKWATNASEPLSEEYLFARTMRGGRPVGKSVLQKLHSTFVKLSSESGSFTLRLITNRALDNSHPLLGHIDGRTQLLVPYAAVAGPSSAAAKAVTAWAEHVGTSRDDLLEMLSHLEFHPGRTIPSELDHVRALMVAAGLDDSNAALQHGRDLVAEWVVSGKRILTKDDIETAVCERGLRRLDPSAILSVQAIDTDPHSDDATIALNWVGLFEGDSPALRVQPHDPAAWAKMDDQLMKAAEELEAAGWRSTVVRGALRQATFFRVGSALPGVRGHTLRYLQRDQWWSTDATKSPIAPPTVTRTLVGDGTDLAVAVGIAVDPTAAVFAYLQDQRLPVDQLVSVEPARGVDDQSIGNAGQATTYAQTIRDIVRQELDSRPGAGRIHLFLAGPGGLALMLGHRWNRLRPTIIYEHLGPGRGYTPTFVVDA